MFVRKQVQNTKRVFGQPTAFATNDYGGGNAWAADADTAQLRLNEVIEVSAHKGERAVTTSRARPVDTALFESLYDRGSLGLGQFIHGIPRAIKCWLTPELSRAAKRRRLE